MVILGLFFPISWSVWGIGLLSAVAAALLIPLTIGVLGYWHGPSVQSSLDRMVSIEMKELWGGVQKGIRDINAADPDKKLGAMIGALNYMGQFMTNSAFIGGVAAGFIGLGMVAVGVPIYLLHGLDHFVISDQNPVWYFFYFYASTFAASFIVVPIFGVLLALIFLPINFAFKALLRIQDFSQGGAEIIPGKLKVPQSVLQGVLTLAMTVAVIVFVWSGIIALQAVGLGIIAWIASGIIALNIFVAIFLWGISSLGWMAQIFKRLPGMNYRKARKKMNRVQHRVDRSIGWAFIGTSFVTGLLALLFILKDKREMEQEPPSPVAAVTQREVAVTAIADLGPVDELDYYQGKWQVVGTQDTGLDARRIKGNYSELQILFGDQQVFTVKGNGYLRASLPDLDWGTSLVTPGYWTSSGEYRHNMQIELDGTDPYKYNEDTGVLTLNGRLIDEMGHLKANDFTIEFRPDDQDQVIIKTSFTLEAEDAFGVDLSRSDEAIKIIQLSSNYVNENINDVTGMTVSDGQGQVIGQATLGRMGKLFSDPKPFGAGGGLVLEGNKKGDKPTIAVEVTGVEVPWKDNNDIVVQGWESNASRNPGDSNNPISAQNQDDIGVWIAIPLEGKERFQGNDIIFNVELTITASKPRSEARAAARSADARFAPSHTARSQDFGHVIEATTPNASLRPRQNLDGSVRAEARGDHFRLNRREFLIAGLGAAAAGLWLPAGVRAEEPNPIWDGKEPESLAEIERYSPQERLKIYGTLTREKLTKLLHDDERSKKLLEAAEELPREDFHVDPAKHPLSAERLAATTELMKALGLPTDDPKSLYPRDFYFKFLGPVLNLAGRRGLSDSKSVAEDPAVKYIREMTEDVDFTMWLEFKNFDKLGDLEDLMPPALKQAFESFLVKEEWDLLDPAWERFRDSKSFKDSKKWPKVSLRVFLTTLIQRRNMYVWDENAQGEERLPRLGLPTAVLRFQDIHKYGIQPQQTIELKAWRLMHYPNLQIDASLTNIHPQIFNGFLGQSQRIIQSEKQFAQFIRKTLSSAIYFPNSFLWANSQDAQFDLNKYTNQTGLMSIDTHRQLATRFAQFVLQHPEIWNPEKMSYQDIFDIEMMEGLVRDFHAIWETDYLKDLNRPDYGTYLIDDFLPGFLEGREGMMVVHAKHFGTSRYAKPMRELARQIRANFHHFPRYYQETLQVPLVRYEQLFADPRSKEEDRMKASRELYLWTVEMMVDYYVNSALIEISNARRLGITDIKEIELLIKTKAHIRPAVEFFYGRHLRILSDENYEDVGILSAHAEEAVLKRKIAPIIWEVVLVLAQKKNPFEPKALSPVHREALELYELIAREKLTRFDLDDPQHVSFFLWWAGQGDPEKFKEWRDALKKLRDEKADLEGEANQLWQAFGRAMNKGLPQEEQVVVFPIEGKFSEMGRVTRGRFMANLHEILRLGLKEQRELSEKLIERYKVYEENPAKRDADIARANAFYNAFYGQDREGKSLHAELTPRRILTHPEAQGEFVSWLRGEIEGEFKGRRVEDAKSRSELRGNMLQAASFKPQARQLEAWSVKPAARPVRAELRSDQPSPEADPEQLKEFALSLTALTLRDAEMIFSLQGLVRSSASSPLASLPVPVKRQMFHEDPERILVALKHLGGSLDLRPKKKKKNGPQRTLFQAAQASGLLNEDGSIARSELRALSAEERAFLTNRGQVVLDFLSAREVFDVATGEWRTIESEEDFLREGPFNIMLILGSSDQKVPEVAARLGKLLREQSPDMTIMTSGKWGTHEGGVSGLFLDENGERLEEAVYFKNVMETLGVHVDFVEKDSTNSGANIQESRLILDENKIYPERFALLQIPYLQKRAGVTFNAQYLRGEETLASLGIEKVVSYSPHRIDLSDAALTDEALVQHIENGLSELARLGLGESAHLHQYAEKGYITPVTFSDEVKNAVRELEEKGYRSEVRSQEILNVLGPLIPEGKTVRKAVTELVKDVGWENVVRVTVAGEEWSRERIETEGDLTFDDEWTPLRMYFRETRRKFGNTGLEFFPIGVGTIWMGRRWPMDKKDYEPPTDDEIESYLLEAFEKMGNPNGAVMIDTAAGYGLSEEKLGTFFKKHPHLLDKAFIATKWGETFNVKNEKSKQSYSWWSLWRSARRSWKMLGKIDLLYIHSAPMKALRNKRAIASMQKMKAKGQYGIRLIGVSISDEKTLEAVFGEAAHEDLLAPFDVIQIPRKVFFERPEWVSTLQEKGIAIVLNRPIQQAGEQTPEEAYREILARPEFSMVLTGTRTHLTETIDYTKPVDVEVEDKSEPEPQAPAVPTLEEVTEVVRGYMEAGDFDRASNEIANARQKLGKSPELVALREEWKRAKIQSQGIQNIEDYEMYEREARGLIRNIPKNLPKEKKEVRGLKDILDAFVKGNINRARKTLPNVLQVVEKETNMSPPEESVKDAIVFAYNDLAPFLGLHIDIPTRFVRSELRDDPAKQIEGEVENLYLAIQATPWKSDQSANWGSLIREITPLALRNVPLTTSRSALENYLRDILIRFIGAADQPGIVQDRESEEALNVIGIIRRLHALAKELPESKPETPKVKPVKKTPAREAPKTSTKPAERKLDPLPPGFLAAQVAEPEDSFTEELRARLRELSEAAQTALTPWNPNKSKERGGLFQKITQISNRADEVRDKPEDLLTSLSEIQDQITGKGDPEEAIAKDPQSPAVQKVLGIISSTRTLVQQGESPQVQPRAPTAEVQALSAETPELEAPAKKTPPPIPQKDVPKGEKTQTPKPSAAATSARPAFPKSYRELVRIPYDAESPETQEALQRVLRDMDRTPVTLDEVTTPEGKLDVKALRSVMEEQVVFVRGRRPPIFELARFGRKPIPYETEEGRVVEEHGALIGKSPFADQEDHVLAIQPYHKTPGLLNYIHKGRVYILTAKKKEPEKPKAVERPKVVERPVQIQIPKQEPKPIVEPKPEPKAEPTFEPAKPKEALIDFTETEEEPAAGPTEDAPEVTRVYTFTAPGNVKAKIDEDTSLGGAYKVKSFTIEGVEGKQPAANVKMLIKPEAEGESVKVTVELKKRSEMRENEQSAKGKVHRVENDTMPHALSAMLATRHAKTAALTFAREINPEVTLPSEVLGVSRFTRDIFEHPERLAKQLGISAPEAYAVIILELFGEAARSENESSPILAKARETLGQYAWVLDALTAKSDAAPFHLVVPIRKEGKIQPEDHLGIFLLLGASKNSYDRLELVTSLSDEDALKLQKLFHLKAKNQFGFHSFDKKLRVLGTDGATSNGAPLQSVIRKTVNGRRKDISGILYHSEKFLKKLGYASQTLRLHHKALDHDAAVIVAATLLRQVEDDPQYEILQLKTWLQLHGVNDIHDFVKHISDMIQVLREAALATGAAA